MARSYVIRRTTIRYVRTMAQPVLRPQHVVTAPAEPAARDGPMDPLGTLIVSLGTLIVLDLAALQLAGSRRPRNRTRAARSR
jgi:hypothetical protein